MKHTYDWQAEERNNYELTFRAWFLTRVMSYMDDAPGGTASKELIERLRVSSDNFTNVEVGVTVNGEEVDAEAFLNGMEAVIKSQVEREVQHELRQMPNLDKMQQEIDRLQEILRTAVDTAAQHLDVELDSWDSWH